MKLGLKDFDIVEITGDRATSAIVARAYPSDAGLDISALDVLMIFPAWGAGEGAVYRLDNVKVTTK